MKTCASCKHWGKKPFGNKEHETGLFRSCGSPAMYRGHGVKDEVINAFGVILEDGEGWGIMTGAEFGCLRYKMLPYMDSLSQSERDELELAQANTNINQNGPAK